jgi:hypothetical protein
MVGGSPRGPEKLLTAFVRNRSPQDSVHNDERPRVSPGAPVVMRPWALLLTLSLMVRTGVARLIGVTAGTVVVRDL